MGRWACTHPCRWVGVWRACGQPLCHGQPPRAPVCVPRSLPGHCFKGQAVQHVCAVHPVGCEQGVGDWSACNCPGTWQSSPLPCPRFHPSYVCSCCCTKCGLCSTKCALWLHTGIQAAQARDCARPGSKPAGGLANAQTLVGHGMSAAPGSPSACCSNLPRCCGVWEGNVCCCGDANTPVCCTACSLPVLTRLQKHLFHSCTRYSTLC
jgi:hypothetical protein